MKLWIDVPGRVSEARVTQKNNARNVRKQKAEKPQRLCRIGMYWNAFFSGKRNAVDRWHMQVHLHFCGYCYRSGAKERASRSGALGGGDLAPIANAFLNKQRVNKF